MGFFSKMFKADPEVDFQMALQEETMKRNFEKAAWLYQKAVDNGHFKAKFFLAEMYFEGRGVTKDYNRALNLLKESALAGYDKAIRLLSEINENNKNRDANLKNHPKQTFGFGDYNIDVSLNGLSELSELNDAEYRQIGRYFDGQKNYHVPQINFLDLVKFSVEII